MTSSQVQAYNGVNPSGVWGHTKSLVGGSGQNSLKLKSFWFLDINIWAKFAVFSVFCTSDSCLMCDCVHVTFFA